MRTGFERFVDLVAERDHPNRVLLLLHQIAKAGSGRASVIEFAPTSFTVFPVGLFPVPHRFAAVDQQMATEIGFLFILFNVQPVCFGPNFPINVTQIIARSVLTVGGKFDSEPVVGTTMLPRDKSFDHRTGAHL